MTVCVACGPITGAGLFLPLGGGVWPSLCNVILRPVQRLSPVSAIPPPRVCLQEVTPCRKEGINMPCNLLGDELSLTRVISDGLVGSIECRKRPSVHVLYRVPPSLIEEVPILLAYKSCLFQALIIGITRSTWIPNTAAYGKLCTTQLHKVWSIAPPPLQTILRLIHSKQPSQQIPHITNDAVIEHARAFPSAISWPSHAI